MTPRRHALRPLLIGLRRAAVFACLTAIFTPLMAGRATAQFGGGGGNFGFQQVGGISIDTDGIIRAMDAGAVEALAKERRAALADVAMPAKPAVSAPKAG